MGDGEIRLDLIFRRVLPDFCNAGENAPESIFLSLSHCCSIEIQIHLGGEGESDDFWLCPPPLSHPAKTHVIISTIKAKLLSLVGI